MYFAFAVYWMTMNSSFYWMLFVSFVLEENFENEQKIEERFCKKYVIENVFST